MGARQREMNNCQRETHSQVGGQTCKQKHIAMQVLAYTVMGPQGEEQQPPPHPTPRIREGSTETHLQSQEDTFNRVMLLHAHYATMPPSVTTSTDERIARQSRNWKL